MKATLLIRCPNTKHYEARLGHLSTIGRARSQDIQVPDGQVSRQHMAISVLHGRYWIQDRCSQNGTLLNGKPLFGPTMLCVGDVIKIGDTTLIFSDGCQVDGRCLEAEMRGTSRSSGRPADRLSRIELPRFVDDSSSGSMNE